MINWVVYVTMYMVNNMGLPISSMHIKGRDFGIGAISNVGVFGMKKGFAPMCHQAGAAIIVAMGQVHKKVCAENGSLVIKDKLLFNYTSDHRYADGGRAIPCINTIYAYMKDP